MKTMPLSPLEFLNRARELLATPEKWITRSLARDAEGREVSPCLVTALEILTRARELLATPEKWITRSLARDDLGFDVSPWDPSATRFCALGAVARVATLGRRSYAPFADESQREAENLLADALWPRRYYCVDTFNDSSGTSHADVLALFDRAIEAAAAKGGAS